MSDISEALRDLLAHLEARGVTARDVAEEAGVEPWCVDAALSDEMPTLSPRLCVAGIRLLRLKIEAV